MSFDGFALDFQLNADKLNEVMVLCLIDKPDINWLEVDSRIVVKIFTDFFSQLNEMRSLFFMRRVLIALNF